MNPIDNSNVSDNITEGFAVSDQRLPLFNPDALIGEISRFHSGEYYLAPEDLRVSPTKVRRALVIGSCLINQLLIDGHSHGYAEYDFLMTNNFSTLPDVPPAPIADYDFQIIQLGLNFIVPENSFWRLDANDNEGHLAVFERACERVDIQINEFLKWNVKYGLLTFVTNFMLPQQDMTGRLAPRYAWTNAIYFVEQLNSYLEKTIRKKSRAYILDLDKISASLGRRYIQDDSVSWLTHNAVMGYGGDINNRLEYVPPFSDHYNIRWAPDFTMAIWSEVIAMMRVVQQTDAVKLVVFDLDDTLWAGVLGDSENYDFETNKKIGHITIEGWPMGLVEAIFALKKRGIMLAIISKNDLKQVQAVWNKIFSNRLDLTDFVSFKINWQPKVKNMEEILDEVNLLPQNVVFVDDNPVERNGMRYAFPDMRVIGRYPYYLRRILMWAPETQVPIITDESSRRTSMVQAQVVRETMRKSRPREEFLASLNLTLCLKKIELIESVEFERALELINKTNQFNTTGRRWSKVELSEFQASEGEIFVFEAKDCFTNYGLIGVVLITRLSVIQFVMSCRVVGLGIEFAVMSLMLRHLTEESKGVIEAEFTETSSNLLCRDFFSRCGFIQIDGKYLSLEDNKILIPDHIII